MSFVSLSNIVEYYEILNSRSNTGTDWTNSNLFSSKPWTRDVEVMWRPHRRWWRPCPRWVRLSRFRKPRSMRSSLRSVRCVNNPWDVFEELRSDRTWWPWFSIVVPPLWVHRDNLFLRLYPRECPHFLECPFCLRVVPLLLYVFVRVWFSTNWWLTHKHYRYSQNPHVRQRQEFRVLPRQRHRTCRYAQLPCPRHRVCLQSLSFSARPIFFTSHLSSRRRGGVWRSVFDPGKLLRLLHTTHRSRYWIVGRICARPFPEESFLQKVRSRRCIVSTRSRTIVRRP